MLVPYNSERQSDLFLTWKWDEIGETSQEVIDWFIILQSWNWNLLSNANNTTSFREQKMKKYCMKIAMVFEVPTL